MATFTIPDYRRKNRVYEFEINDNDYITTLEDFFEYFDEYVQNCEIEQDNEKIDDVKKETKEEKRIRKNEKRIELWEDLKEQTNCWCESKEEEESECCYLLCLKQLYVDSNKRLTLILIEYPENDKPFYRKKFIPFKRELFKVIRKNHEVVENNLERIVEVCNNKLKYYNLPENERLKVYKANYYKIHKKETTQLTEEEKKEKKKLCNAKYYQKIKKEPDVKPSLLTEEQKKENRKNAQAKYYQNKALKKNSAEEC